MSLILIGPWLNALWIRVHEAGHCETVSVHSVRAERVANHVAQVDPVLIRMLVRALQLWQREPLRTARQQCSVEKPVHWAVDPHGAQVL